MLSEAIKKRWPEIPILFGGANCEGPMGLETVRQFTCVDYVVSGEADCVITELVSGLLEGRAPSVEGVYSKSTPPSCDNEGLTNAPSIQNLDDLPIPDFTEFYERYVNSPSLEGLTPRVIFESSRGCWWGQKKHCTFCGLNGLGMAFRSKTPERVLQELIGLTTCYPGSQVTVVDNILKMEFFRSVLPQLAEQQLPIQLFYEIKSNLRRDQVAQLRSAGITEVQPGIESFSDHVLELMRKGVTGLQNIQLLKWCEEYGILPRWNFLYGFPGEEPGEYAWMASVLPLLEHLQPPTSAVPIRLDRFSPNFDNAKEFGFASVEPAPAYRFIYPEVDEAARQNLAYFFAYDYTDGRTPRTYTAELRMAVDQWKDAAQSSHLVGFNTSRGLLIFDTRRVATKEFHLLEGVSASLYNYLDRFCVFRLIRPVVPVHSGRLFRCYPATLSG